MRDNHPFDRWVSLETRRQFFGKTAKGLGSAALASLLCRSGSGALATPGQRGGALGPGHFPARVKRVIWLFMAGAPSQLDTYDYKPTMVDRFDTDLPESVRRGQRLTTMTASQARFPIAPTMFQFPQHGECGKRISELLPKTGSMADDLAFVHTVWTEAINHDPAITYIQTGNQIPGKPTLGAWLSYGLGSENENMPAYVVMISKGRGQSQALYDRLWGSGFLPSRHQGVKFRSAGEPVLYLNNPPGIERSGRRKMLDRLAQLNEQNYDRFNDPETQTRISQYEMAYRMQMTVPEIMDISKEPDHVKELYGPAIEKPGSFARNVLLARRMAERGVRFIQLFHRGWDQHGSLPQKISQQCEDIDQPCAALIKDLKQRGMFDDTLIVCGGEFGRTIYSQGKLTETNHGRDHHGRAFSTWLAGAGIKEGFEYGRTDDYSYNILENPVHIRDLNATILNRLGIDHNRLIFRFQGLDQRLTGVEEAHVVKDIIA